MALSTHPIQRDQLLLQFLLSNFGLVGVREFAGNFTLPVENFERNFRSRARQEVIEQSAIRRIRRHRFVRWKGRVGVGVALNAIGGRRSKQMYGTREFGGRVSQWSDVVED